MMDLIQPHLNPPLPPTNVEYFLPPQLYHERRGKYEWWT